jgi:methylamine dehydrogenase accessory protein MauD
VVLWFLVIALVFVVVALARQIGTLHMRLGPRGALEMDDEGPALGEAPAPLSVRTADGVEARIGGPGTAQFLMFVSPGCHICDQVIPSIPVIARAHELAPFVITDSSPAETQVAFRATKLGEAKLVPGIEVAKAYSIPGTPYVVVLDRFGVVRAKGTVNNLEQVEGLVETAQRRVAELDAREAI